VISSIKTEPAFGALAKHLNIISKTQNVRSWPVDTFHGIAIIWSLLEDSVEQVRQPSEVDRAVRVVLSAERRLSLWPDLMSS
jgi:hypothetical protein